MDRFIIKALIYVGLITSVVVVYSLLQSVVLRELPNDYSRHEVLMDVLNDEDIEADMMVFGDSRTMFGVNTKTISNELYNHPTIINMSSFSQELEEGSYFFSKIPNRTNTIIQCVDYLAFKNCESLTRPKAISMILNGYRADEGLSEVVKEPLDVFSESLYKIYYESRTLNRGIMHSYFRSLFDDENYDVSKMEDLYFPHIYTADRAPKYPLFHIECTDNFMINDICIATIKHINNYLAEHDKQYILVLMPINSDICQLDKVKHEKLMKIINNQLQGVTIIDMTFSLESKDFYDGIHPNRSGAEKLSLLIGHRILQVEKR